MQYTILVVIFIISQAKQAVSLSDVVDDMQFSFLQILLVHAKNTEDVSPHLNGILPFLKGILSRTNGIRGNYRQYRYCPIIFCQRAPLFLYQHLIVIQHFCILYISA